jgi:Fur family ferric uptake transcriptional regulator
MGDNLGRLGRGRRITRQRQVILDELRNVKTHPSADEVYEMTRRRLPRVSLATVYRNLEDLAEQGEIQKLELAGTQRRYDGTVKKHYHVRCTGCGRMDDIEMEPFDWIERDVRQASDYRIFSHRLEFAGLCPSCQKARSAGK